MEQLQVEDYTIVVRLSEQDYRKLSALADERDLPVDTLARLWMKDDIAFERNGQVTMWSSRK